MNELLVDTSAAGKRLDSFLAAKLPENSRSFWQKAIKAGYVKIDGKPTIQNVAVTTKSKVTVLIPATALSDQKLPVVFENGDVVVFDKPAGVLTHSKGTFNPEFTVASYMQSHYYPDDISDRPGIVHRLDRGTSGLIICAKNETAQKSLMSQFSSRKVAKTYIAVVEGVPKSPELILQWPIQRNPRKPQTFRVHANGKPAETHLRVLRRGAKASVVELSPKTGRTHQLRVHMAKLGHPIVGDEFYDGPKYERLLLHATRLELTLPSGERRAFTSPAPREFMSYIKS